MSPRLIVSAVASTMATAALALGAPHIEHGSRGGAGIAAATAGMTAPGLTLPVIFPR